MPISLFQRARRARREAQMLMVVTQQVHIETQWIWLACRRQERHNRERRERARLRLLMPEANPWTIELTAHILVARNLDHVVGESIIGSPPRKLLRQGSAPKATAHLVKGQANGRGRTFAVAVLK